MIFFILICVIIIFIKFKPNIELKSRKQIIPHYFYCKICFELCRIPVHPKFPCCTNSGFGRKDVLDCCNYICCLRCIRSYLQLNKPKSRRSNNVKCLVGYGRLNLQNSNASSYSISAAALQIINDYSEKWECEYKDHQINNSCNNTFDSQHNLLRHIRNDCDYSNTKCSSCHYINTRINVRKHEEKGEHFPPRNSIFSWVRE